MAPILCSLSPSEVCYPKPPIILFLMQELDIANDVNNSFKNAAGNGTDLYARDLASYFATVDRLYSVGARNFVFNNVVPFDRAQIGVNQGPVLQEKMKVLLVLLDLIAPSDRILLVCSKVSSNSTLSLPQRLQHTVLRRRILRPVLSLILVCLLCLYYCRQPPNLSFQTESSPTSWTISPTSDSRHPIASVGHMRTGLAVMSILKLIQHVLGLFLPVSGSSRGLKQS